MSTLHLPLLPTQKAKDSMMHLFTGETGWSRILPPKEAGTGSVLEGFPWVPILSPALENAIDGPLSAMALLPEHWKEEMGPLGKRVEVSCLLQGSAGSHRHSGLCPATSGRFTHGQRLSAQGPPGTAHSQRHCITTRHGLEGPSAKGRLSPGELKLWKDRHTLKGPCSWQLTAVATSGSAGEG